MEIIIETLFWIGWLWFAFGTIGAGWMIVGLKREASTCGSGYFQYVHEKAAGNVSFSQMLFLDLTSHVERIIKGPVTLYQIFTR